MRRKKEKKKKKRGDERTETTMNFSQYNPKRKDQFTQKAM